MVLNLKSLSSCCWSALHIGSMLFQNFFPDDRANLHWQTPHHLCIAARKKKMDVQGTLGPLLTWILFTQLWLNWNPFGVLVASNSIVSLKKTLYLAISWIATRTLNRFDKQEYLSYTTDDLISENLKNILCPETWSQAQIKDMRTDPYNLLADVLTLSKDYSSSGPYPIPIKGGWREGRLHLYSECI